MPMVSTNQDVCIINAHINFGKDNLLCMLAQFCLAILPGNPSKAITGKLKLLKWILLNKPSNHKQAFL